jgi:hypothetical protein
MSYAYPPVPPPLRETPPAPPVGRPTAVTAAGALLAFMAAAGLAYAVVGAVVANGIVDRFRAAARVRGVAASDVDGLSGLVSAGPVTAVILGLGVTVLLAVLAVGVLRGHSAYRVVTWGVCAAGLLCGGGALLFSVGQRLGGWAGGGHDPESLLALADATPGWWLWTNGTLSVLQALGYVVVAVLLAVPAANRFFRPSP